MPHAAFTSSFRASVYYLLLNLGGMLVWHNTLHAASSSGHGADNFAGVIRLQEEYLTVQVTNASLRQVLAEFEKRSGIQVRWLTSSEDAQISIGFSALPLAEALQRLLGENNFLLFYRQTPEGFMPSQLWISARSQNRKSGHLSVALGLLNTSPSSTEESVETLMQAIQNEQDPAARLDALTRLGGYAQEDPRVASVLQQFARTDPDPQVREAAEELLQNLE